MNTDLTHLKAISAYLPAHLIADLVAQPGVSLEGRQTRAEVVTLFADISGFTGMSETLAGLGKQGAEDLTRVLNDYFTTMVEFVRDYGGFVLRFSGDAITCQFPGSAEGVQLAVSCALVMQQAMSAFAAVETKAGLFTLRMKIGISGGTGWSITVGQEPLGLEYVLLGQPVDRAVAAEGVAEPGEVAVDGACSYLNKAGHLVTLGIQASEQRGDFRIVSPDTDLVTPIQAASSFEDQLTGHQAAAVVDRLTPFIPPNVVQQIEAGHRAFVAEHRRVVSLFVAFEGLDYAQDADAGQKLQAYFVAMQRLIYRFGGRLNRVITGDKGNLLHVIFGAPVAHEDNERRAVRCALAMREEIAADDSLLFVRAQRMGIASGYVFAGNVGSPRRQEYTVMGDVVNTSARLMQAAPANGILMDEQTVRRIGGSFNVEALPPIFVKGKRAAVPVWRPVDTQVRGPLPWSGAGLDFLLRTSPLVGRTRELAKIERVFDLALAGHGQLLDISGEAGVGKSRLFAEAFPRAIERGFESYGGTCPAYGIQTPYLPWVMLFRALFGLSDDGELEVAPEAVLKEQLTRVDPSFAAWLPLMAQFLGYAVPDTPLTAGLTPELRRQRLFDLVLSVLRARAAQTPLLLVFEDLHSADAISLEMLDYVARNIGRYPILIVALHRRPLRLDTWQDYDYYNQVILDELPAQDAIELARARLGMAEISPALESLLLRGESRANPFFLEEMLNALIDQGYLVPRETTAGFDLVGDLADVDMPDSIQSLVMSRIDRLDEASKLAIKVASVVGRSFEESLLHAIYPVAVSQAALHTSLQHLSTLDLTPLDRPAPDWEYAFRHVITQEVAYESLLYAHRQDLHHRVGECLEQRYAGNLEEHYELLAYHYAESADQEKGWHYLLRAGDKARRSYANESAIDFYAQALALAPRAPDVDVAHQALADVYHLLGRYDPALDHYRHALDSASSQAESALLRRKIAKTWAVQGLYDDALHYLHLVEETLDAAEDAAELVRVYDDMGWIARQRGEYETALDYCLRALTLIEGEGDGVPRSDVDSALRAQLLHNLGSIYARLGEYDKGIAYFQQCIEDSEARDDLYEAGRSYVNLAVVYWRQGNFDLVAQYLRQSLRIFGRIGYTHGTAMCHNNLGVLHFTQGRYAEAISAYNESLRIRQEIGDQQGIADLYNNLGEVYQALSDDREALRYLQRAAQMFVELGDKATLVDTYRLLAEVELSLGDTAEALTYAQESLTLAKALGNVEYQGAAARMLGRIYCEIENLDASCRYLEESLDILASTENRLEIAQTHLEFGKVLLLKDRHGALASLQRAAELFEVLGLQAEKAKVEALIADNALN